MEPLVSVIIPTYNRAEYVCDAIESVLNQTYKNIEIIVVDDGSTDDTKEWIKKYLSSSKLKYIYQENRGVSSARNTGIKIAKGEYLAFLDSDDLFLPKKIELQVKEFKKSPLSVGIIFTGVVESGETIYIPRARTRFEAINKLNLLIKYKSAFSTNLHRKVVFEKVGLFDENLRLKEDIEFLWRALKYFDVKLMPINSIRKRNPSDSLSNSAQYKENVASWVYVMNKLCKIYPLEEEIKEIDSKAELGMQHFYWGRCLLMELRVKELYPVIREEFLITTKFLPNFAPAYLFLAFVEKLMGLTYASEEHFKLALKKFKSINEIQKWLETLKFQQSISF